MDPFLELAALLPAGLTPPLVDDGFFDYPQNQTQYKELAERICRQVEASHEYSKNARPYPLKIVERWCPSSFAWNNISFESRLYRHRALPEMMHCTAFYEAFADIMIILTNPLWIGTAVRGQVWRATMRLEGSYPRSDGSDEDISGECLPSP
ncbi:hypothetical protein SCP_0600300 [Sparassis crispa]|uniref:Uncharacterized protein n=1 Tax=Sparassis crispa TaxID=139825 RepID=A0A401GPA8_9APHY|nr:hypothetical protein SCP_0600300 [Sparassis crispa]GBE84053.1 hypothetical protein SCP_0600300 [Sparassis crispa]